MVDFRQPEMLLFLVATIGVTPSAEETSWYNWTGFWLPWSTVPGKPTDILFFFSNLLTPHRNGVLQFAWTYCLRSIVLNNCTVRIPDQPKKVRFDLATLFRALLCFALMRCAVKNAKTSCHDGRNWRRNATSLFQHKRNLLLFWQQEKILGPSSYSCWGVFNSFDAFWVVTSAQQQQQKSNNPLLMFFSRCVSRKCCRNLFRGKKHRRNDDNLFVGFVSTAPRCWWTELQH